MTNAGAIRSDVCTVVDLSLRSDQPDALGPIVDLLRPVRVGLVAGEMGQPRCQFEELTIRHAVLVVVSAVEGEDLPSQSPGTCCVVPAGGLVLKYIFGKCEVGCGVSGGGK